MKEKGGSDKFIKGISIQSVVSLVNAIIQLVVFSVLSRLLSKEDFGYYAVLMGITSIFMSISDAGIGSAVIQQKNLTDQFRSTSFSLSIIFSLLLFVIFVFSSPFIARILNVNSMIVPLCIMSIPLILHSINGYASAILRRNLNFATIGKFKILSYSISSMVAIIYAFYGGGVYSLLCLFCLDSILYSIFLFVEIDIPKLEIKKSEAKKVLEFGGWLSLGVIMSSISNQLDKVILGRWLSPEKLGAYFRPSGFILHIISTINSIFDSVLFPILSNYQDNREQFRSLLQKSFSLLSSFGFILTAVFFFNSKLIILIFFGNKWMDLLPILQITSFSALFMLHNTLADCFFRSFNLVKVGFYIRFFGVLLSLLLLYEGAKYDIIGVALSVLISSFILVVFKFIYLGGKTNTKMYKLIEIWFASIRPVIPIAIIGILFGLFPSSLIILIVKAIIISMALLFELVFFPKYIGEEYALYIYPKVKQKFIMIINLIKE